MSIHIVLGYPVNDGILQLLKKRRQYQATADKRVVYGSLAIIDNFDRSREISFSHQETGLISTYMARAVDWHRSKIRSRSVV
jgi:hypothetical protein